MKKLIFVLFVSFVLAGILNNSASAQGQNCRTPPVTICFGPPCSLDMVPPTATCVQDLIVTCSWTIPGPGCAPGTAAPETACGSCQKNRPVAGSPINLSNGNTFIIQTDISIPGLGGGLTLTRTWNSLWPSTQTGSIQFMFGPDWTYTY